MREETLFVFDDKSLYFKSTGRCLPMNSIVLRLLANNYWNFFKLGCWLIGGRKDQSVDSSGFVINVSNDSHFVVGVRGKFGEQEAVNFGTNSGAVDSLSDIIIKFNKNDLRRGIKKMKKRELTS